MNERRCPASQLCMRLNNKSRAIAGRTARCRYILPLIVWVSLHSNFLRWAT